MRDLIDRPAGALALRALGDVVRGAPPSQAERPTTEAFAEALVAPTADASERAVARLTAAGVRPEELLDDYIPAAARLLGRGWAEDRLSFATVTIVCARLQGLLRRIEPPVGVREGTRGAVLIVLVPGETHSLGAMVAAAQLRRAGLSVRLVLGTLDEAIDAAARGAPDLIAISAAAGSKLASLRRMVESLRRATSTQTAVAIGGSITADEGACGADAAENTVEAIAVETGADHVSSDILEVAARCGLIAPKAAGTRADRAT